MPGWATAQDSLEAAIRRGQLDYEPLLSAMMRQPDGGVTVQLKNQTNVTYTDFATLHSDFGKKLMSEARYRAAVAELAQRARSQIISHGAGAETHLRPLLDWRQSYDFIGAAEFVGTPNTEAGRRRARAMQEAYFERLSVPELVEARLSGAGPIYRRAGAFGAGAGAGMTALIELPNLIESWEQDPYAGRRYLAHTALGGLGDGGQALAEQALRMRISQMGLDAAASRAAAGRSISALTYFTPGARFGGSTVLGGVASGGLTAGGMWLDESYFGADYTTIDYSARTARAFVSGSVASGVGALTTAAVTAKFGWWRGSGRLHCARARGRDRGLRCTGRDRGLHRRDRSLLFVRLCRR